MHKHVCSVNVRVCVLCVHVLCVRACMRDNCVYAILPSGDRAGLQSSKVLRAENDEMRWRRERELRELEPSMMGKEADTVHRDKHSRRIDPKLEKLKRMKEEAEQDEQFYKERGYV